MLSILLNIRDNRLWFKNYDAERMWGIFNKVMTEFTQELKGSYKEGFPNFFITNGNGMLKATSNNLIEMRFFEIGFRTSSAEKTEPDDEPDSFCFKAK